ncbi:hypothetical protein DFJ69_6211 [Thermomonospora umbrina]|uniref:Uncharacterized protein n=1 Tax=Thermomonospora umbrina TaxID=111806 RepID=A0A3D9T7K8_9ACTN|nr:hypothetical protein DFJ69_6211 [Thermomonospora umbrina]
MIRQPDAADPQRRGRGTDAERRRDGLLALLAELEHMGTEPRLELVVSGVRVLCIGAGSTFAFVSEDGQVLGPTSEVHAVADVLVTDTRRP